MTFSRLIATDRGLLDFSLDLHSNAVRLGESVTGLSETTLANYLTSRAHFVDAYNTWHNAATRTPAACQFKDEKGRSLRNGTRSVVAAVRAFAGMSDSTLKELGIPPIKPRRHEQPAPTESPVVSIEQVVGARVKVRLSQLDDNRRGRPAGAAGATIMSFVGENYPTSGRQWTFQSNVTKTTAVVDFPADVAPGTKVWIAASWVSRRLESGPMCQPISINLPGGGVRLDANDAGATDEQPPMKIAA
jgi:hypothetical protein